MPQFTTVILKFDNKGEKTGWSYIIIPPHISWQLKPGNKRTFRVKGKLDNYSISKVALLPMGKGSFIMPINASMRRATGKIHGATINVNIQSDNNQMMPDAEFMQCLAHEPAGLEFFKMLAKSHQGYFSKWIQSAKTPSTKVRRIANAVTALAARMSYGEMLRSLKRS